MTMSDAHLVDVLGMIAGAVWMSAAIYFQLIREGEVHPAFVSALFLIGVALTMASSAIAIAGRPGIVELLAVLANALFIVLGVAASFTIEKYAKIQEAKTVDDVEYTS